MLVQLWKVKRDFKPAILHSYSGMKNYNPTQVISDALMGQNISGNTYYVLYAQIISVGESYF